MEFQRESFRDIGDINSLSSGELEKHILHLVAQAEAFGLTVDPLAMGKAVMEVSGKGFSDISENTILLRAAMRSFGTPSMANVLAGTLQAYSMSAIEAAKLADVLSERDKWPQEQPTDQISKA